MAKTERGFKVKPLEKLFDSLLSSAGLESCAPVHNPGVRSEMRVPEEEEPVLGPAEHEQFRTIVGKLFFSLENVQTFNSASRNATVLRLETCRGQSVFADTS